LSEEMLGGQTNFCTRDRAVSCLCRHIWS